jgi:hypothetical protein
MQTEIRLNPVYGGFGFAIFSDTGLNLQNNLTVTGNAGNDGDLYTNGPFICSNGTTDYGSVSTQGAATLSNSCNLIQDLRANGAISMSNTAHVGHDATSSTGSITMSNSARIDNNARAATTCSSCTGRVGGTITASSPSAAPAPIPLPVINYDSAAWQTAGYTIHSDNNCATADTWIEGLNGSSTKYVERISPTCTLDLSKNTITLGADLAIITDGSILTAQKTTIQSSSSTVRSLHLIIPKSSVGSCTGTQNISFANQTDFINVRVFIYTPCTVALSNNNVGDGGQIIGGTVLIQNHITFAYRPFLVPGAGSVTGYNPDVAYLREIKNGS